MFQEYQFQNPVKSALEVIAPTVAILWALLTSQESIWQYVALISGFVFIFFILLPAWAAWIGRLIIESQREIKRTAIITPTTEMLKQLGKLRPHQIEAWLSIPAKFRMTPAVAGAIAVYDMDGEEIPADFVWEFLEECGDAYLKPIRSYSDGSNGREWAKAITAFFVLRGFAVDSAGNLPARWTKGKEQALSWFYLEENPPTLQKEDTEEGV